jgi:hypothetical protein
MYIFQMSNFLITREKEKTRRAKEWSSVRKAEETTKREQKKLERARFGEEVRQRKLRESSRKARRKRFQKILHKKIKTGRLQRVLGLNEYKRRGIRLRKFSAEEKAAIRTKPRGFFDY